MLENLPQLSQQARIAVQNGDWVNVEKLANKILQLYNNNSEGYFLNGLVRMKCSQLQPAVSSLLKALELDSDRYDAAIELSNLYMQLLRYADAFDLLNKYEKMLSNSPLYLDMAARVFSGLGLHSRAWPLYNKANQLQPNIDNFLSNLAACSVLVGNVEQAEHIYQALLNKYPHHQKCHYELSKLKLVKDSQHLEQMIGILNTSKLPPERNIYLYYAIGKELEDLERWKESFYYYKLAGESILSASKYNVTDDIKVINQIIDCCNKNWLTSGAASQVSLNDNKVPIFIVGLPRTGTTLTERIISSHSQVESADETFFMQMALRYAAGVEGVGDVDDKIIKKAASADINVITQKYMSLIDYRLSEQGMFVDKYPYNFLYIGFIAKAFPNARIIYLKRNPMDACFAMFKQSYFKFSYSLEDLGHYYVAQEKLRNHWQSILSDRLITVEYECLVTGQEQETRNLLENLGLKFEENCMSFEKNTNSSASASTLQVRKKIHTRSIGKWKNFIDELKPLQNHLNANGIETK